MTLRLILTRHAKSSWASPTMDDHARPLNRRGESSAKAIGAWLAAQGYVPELALVSSATRTRETWALIAEAFDPVPEALKGRLAVARAAAADLKKTLGGRLTAAMKDGPDSAIDVCAKEAEKLSAEVGARHGVKIGPACAIRGTPRAHGSRTTSMARRARWSETWRRLPTT